MPQSEAVETLWKGLQFCDCGDPDPAVQAFVVYMTGVYTNQNFYNRHEWIEKCGGLAAWTFCCYEADRLRFTEHGGQVTGAGVTLTDAGAEWLQSVRRGGIVYRFGEGDPVGAP